METRIYQAKAEIETGRNVKTVKFDGGTAEDLMIWRARIREQAPLGSTATFKTW
jgi:hypothetical protein